MAPAETRQFFGTDGIRGPVGGPLVNGRFFCRLAVALRRLLHGRCPEGRPPRVLIGHDGRYSAGHLRAALLRGLGNFARVWDGGMLPTPALGHGVRRLGCDCAIVLTASHNGAGDNGLKLLGPDGGKWSISDELQLESLLADRDREGGPAACACDCRECRGEILDHYRRRWEEFFPKNALAGLRIVLDCANGAASSHGAEFLTKLGADAFAIAASPDGYNINGRCGSEHPGELLRQVRARRADWGMALDGDGDRVLLCDGDGNAVPGEHLLALLALEGPAAGLVAPSPLVTTVLANGALDPFLRERGVDVLRTEVGDRPVAEAMAARGCSLGGEPSGHVLVPAFGPLADGLFAGVLFLCCLRRRTDHSWRFPLLPTARKNLPVRAKIPLDQLPRLGKMVEELGRSLAGGGRILVRYSGTESLLRLQVEAESVPLAQECLERLVMAHRSDGEHGHGWTGMGEPDAGPGGDAHRGGGHRPDGGAADGKL
ncbi:MAG: hypothetical protein LBT98_01205 [Puniceicoccales bacterium]|nr:hypothetical protein [Puniceicoccales bacterium]